MQEATRHLPVFTLLRHQLWSLCSKTSHAARHVSERKGYQSHCRVQHQSRRRSSSRSEDCTSQCCNENCGRGSQKVCSSSMAMPVTVRVRGRLQRSSMKILSAARTLHPSPLIRHSTFFPRIHTSSFNQASPLATIARASNPGLSPSPS